LLKQAAPAISRGALRLEVSSFCFVVQPGRK